MIKKNDLISLKIEDLTNLGFGVARHEGMVIFISDTVPGDECETKIIKVNKSYAVGRVEKFAKKSSARVEGRCPVLACKSCTYRHVGYTEELKLKADSVRSAFIHEGLSDAKIEPTVPSPCELGYRNKAQYPVSLDKFGDYIIGFYAPKSHRVTEARACPLAPPVFSEILDTLADFFKAHDVSVYDEETGRGLLRHIYLRRAEVGGEILITLVINGESLPAEEELVSILTQKFPDAVGILINVNEKSTNVVLGEKYRTLYGRDYIFDTLGGVRLKITAQSFYQVNRAAADLLYAEAKRLAAPKSGDLLLDLYCGAGSIGLSMAGEAGELIGIEIVESAVECARYNAESNGISNAKFYVGDAKDSRKLLSNAERELGRKIEPNVIILDPPRAGCARELIEYVSTLTPERVVYVSCNPTTLARDVKIFAELGYSYGTVKTFDLFPMTGHVESVVCLTRRICE